MKTIKIQTANNIPNLFYKVMPTLAYLRIPSKTFLSEGIMNIQPYDTFTRESIKQALNDLQVKFTEVEE